MKKYLYVTIILMSCFLLSCEVEKKNNESKESHSKELAKKEYICPMNCEKDKTYKEELKCPVCKMKLVDKKKLDKKE